MIASAKASSALGFIAVSRAAARAASEPPSRPFLKARQRQGSEVRSEAFEGAPSTVALQSQENALLTIVATEQWKAAHPGAGIGLLELSNLANNGTAISLDDRKRETEARLRQRYAGFSRRDF